MKADCGVLLPRIYGCIKFSNNNVAGGIYLRYLEALVYGSNLYAGYTSTVVTRLSERDAQIGRIWLGWQFY